MQKTSQLSIILLAVIAVVAMFSLFTVHEREKAIKLELGKIARADFTPGLYFKIPFVQNVRKFDARIQTLDAEPEQFLTVEKKNVVVDSFVKWRVGNVVEFYKATGGDFARANDRLSQFVKKGLKDEIGQRTIQEVVAGERAEIMGTLTGRIKEGQDPAETLPEKAKALGIEIVDVRIKRVDFSDQISNSVFGRMRAERQRVARDHRAKGHEEAKRIRAGAEKEREVILAKAEGDSQRLRGEGDAIAAETYANAYQQDAEFYAFYRSLNAYKASFKGKEDVLLLGTDNDFFRYFNSAKGK